MDLLQNFVYSFGLNYNKLDQNNFTHNNPQIDALRNNKLASYAPEDKIVTQNIGNLFLNLKYIQCIIFY